MIQKLEKYKREQMGPTFAKQGGKRGVTNRFNPFGTFDKKRPRVQTKGNASIAIMKWYII